MKYANKFVGTLGITILFFTVTSYTVDAKTVIRSDEAVSIAEDQTIEGNFYSAANIINISGTVEEDMVSAGGQININGKVNKDAFLIAGRTDVHGTIGGDLRIVSGEVVIAEPVMGDVLVIGGVVNILSTASISGDVVLYAGRAVIEGSVGGDIIGSVEQLRIDAPVAGNVNVSVTELTLGDRANISGSVSYVSNMVATQSLNATVSGGLSRNDPVFEDKEITISSALVPVLVLLFSILVWYLVSRRTLTRVVNRALTRSPRPILLGFVTLLLAPIAGGILLISTIGSIVGIAILFGYALLVVLSIIGLIAVLGLLLMRAFNQPTSEPTLMSLAVGVVGVVLLMFLPVVGQLVLVAFMLITLGAMVDIMIRPTLK